MRAALRRVRAQMHATGFHRLGLSAVLVLLATTSVRADGPLLAAEAAAGTALTAPQSDQFGAGGALSAAGYAPITRWLLVGAKLRAAFLSDGDAPTDPSLEDPGLGTLESVSALVRLRPLARDSDPTLARGLFIEGGPAGALTGTLARPAFEAAIGYGLPVLGTTLAPTLRYVQVVQPSDSLASDDARLLLLGLEVTLLDGARDAAQPAREGAGQVALPPDLDEDGVPDAGDRCVDTPEDRDGFEDDDGCPELDDDGDGIPDAQDACPRAAEDNDGHDDEDGCPDPDNDGDTFLDGDDQCPDDAEIVNGNNDYDGCPDEGLIEMRNDRIVLEERVLFDFERARVKSAAKPVLEAIVKLFGQHPEWMSIRIEGHADARGNPQYNQELSQRRAENVRAELIAHGIPAAAIEAIGHGSSKPRDLREDEEGYHRNRRVEFVVVARTSVEAAAEAPLDPPSAEPAAAPSAPQSAPSKQGGKQ